MYTLFIDTHLWDILIYLLKDGKVVDKELVSNKKIIVNIFFQALLKLSTVLN